MLTRACKFIGAVTFLVLSMLAAAISLLNTIDLNRYRDLVTQQIDAATGRELVLGPIDVAISLRPTLRARNVALKNAEWSSQSAMVQVERLDASVALLPLLNGRLEIERVHLRGVRLLLETNARGHGNWQFSGGDHRGRSTPPVPIALPLFEEVQLEDVVVSYRDGANGRSASVSLGRLTTHNVRTGPPSGPETRGQFNAVRLEDLELAYVETAAERTASLAAERVQGLVPVVTRTTELERSKNIEQLRVEGLRFEYREGRSGYAMSVALDRLMGRLLNLGTGEKPGGDPNELRIRNLKFSHRQRPSARLTSVDLGQLTARSAGLSQPITLEASGRYRRVLFRATGEIGTIVQLTRGRVYPVDIEVSTSGADLGVKGRIGRHPSGDRLDLRLSLRGGNLSRLSAWTGARLPDIGPYRGHARLRKTGATYRFDDMDVTLGRSRMTGRLALVRSGTRSSVQANLNARMLHMPELVSALRSTYGARRAPNADASASRARLFSERPLHLGLPQSVQLSLVLHARTLVTPRLALRDVAANARLVDGVLTVDPLQARMAGGSMEGGFVLDTRRANPGLSADMVARELDVGELLRVLASSDVLEGKADLALSLRGSGDSVADIAGGLDGHVRVLVEEGRAQVAAMDTFVGGFTRLIGMLFARHSERGTVNCLAGEFQLENGIARSTLLLADTDSSTLHGKGTIDLRNEALDLVVSPKPKTATLSLVVPVKIEGTLADPTFTPSKLAAARKLGGIVAAAVFFPPAVAAALVELGGETNACLRLADDRQVDSEREDDPLPPSYDR
ncbi:MAG: AsmA family protein [Gammaproteobacteria bacterium]|nr:AsmA family protein [Gammaproteobacteria bacterium]NIR83417.1 AsmA family protein [Gammaproteobacteria bacterium]NIR91339.1 AsmA family protein [Gammaproteobacteria bacterium]NIU04579.1 AsmA family protein [Gammaproteobacteria bacterium]NIV51621.1 AsmA family protein [Gammaproteobacteria bacterium]